MPQVQERPKRALNARVHLVLCGMMHPAWLSRSASLVARPELRSKYRGRRARRTQRTGRRATAEIEHLGARKARRGTFSRMQLERLLKRRGRCTFLQL